MDPALGFGPKGKEEKVCHSRKALYGLKQLPCAWFERFVQAVLKYGFRRC